MYVLVWVCEVGMDELEKIKQKLRNTPYSLDKKDSNYNSDMKKFDHAIREQQVITGQVLFSL